MAAIARKHIIAAIESAPCELEYPKYTISATFYRRPRQRGHSGVRVTWKFKDELVRKR